MQQLRKRFNTAEKASQIALLILYIFSQHSASWAAFSCENNAVSWQNKLLRPRHDTWWTVWLAI